MNIRILFEGQKGAGPLFKTISYAKRPIFEGLLAKCPPKGGFWGAGGLLWRSSPAAALLLTGPPRAPGQAPRQEQAPDAASYIEEGPRRTRAGSSEGEGKGPLEGGGP